MFFCSIPCTSTLAFKVWAWASPVAFWELYSMEPGNVFQFILFFYDKKGGKIQFSKGAVLLKASWSFKRRKYKVTRHEPTLSWKKTVFKWKKTEPFLGCISTWANPYYFDRTLNTFFDNFTWHWFMIKMIFMKKTYHLIIDVSNSIFNNMVSKFSALENKENLEKIKVFFTIFSVY